MDKKQDRIAIMRDCQSGAITRAEAMSELKISRMTLYRWLIRYRHTGVMGHGLSGRPSNHKAYPYKNKILGLVRDKYYDCGPTLAAEYLLEEEGLRIHRETLRLWMHEARLMVKTRKRKPYRQRRVRKPCFGDMLQIDGSFHDWFGTGEKACLMNLIDDATGLTLCLFDKEETVMGACMVLWEWCKKYGIPRSIYSDRRNMYVPKEEEKGHYFTMMCRNLGIRLIQANSPQAKGRVERSNRTHQERLMPWLRLKGIKDIGQANKAMAGYLKGHNEKFRMPPLEESEVRKLDKHARLEDYCYIESPRKVSNDWIISYNGRKYQLKPQSIYCPAKATVFVKEALNGKITILYRNLPLNYVSV
jgi:transposase